MTEHTHRAKYLNHLLIGCVLIFAFNSLVFFTIFLVEKIGSWYLLAGISGLLLCAGVYFMASAIGHKIKSDLNRRARQREVQQHFTNDQ